MRRPERLATLTRLLTDRPGHTHSLSQLAAACGVSKATISADLADLREVFARTGLGNVETAAGAAGGVRFFAAPGSAEVEQAVGALCEQLSDPRRILPGGFLYLSDVISAPELTQRLGEVFAARFRSAEPQVVVTLETRGIPVALMTARALGVPLAIVRRASRVSDGTVVTMNYLSGSARRIETMSLPLRALSPKTRVLVIDDFMKAGGTARGLLDLMGEFAAVVVGVGVLIETREPAEKLVREYVSLAVLDAVDEAQRRVLIRPSPWVLAGEAGGEGS